MMNINKLILYYQQEKLIINVSLGNLLGFVKQKLTFSFSSPTLKALPLGSLLLSRGQKQVLALATQTLTRKQILYYLLDVSWLDPAAL